MKAPPLIKRLWRQRVSCSTCGNVFGWMPLELDYRSGKVNVQCGRCGCTGKPQVLRPADMAGAIGLVLIIWGACAAAFLGWWPR